MSLAPNPKVPIGKKEPSILPSLHRKISELKGKDHGSSRAENSLALAPAQASYYVFSDKFNASVFSSTKKMRRRNGVFF